MAGLLAPTGTIIALTGRGEVTTRNRPGEPLINWLSLRDRCWGRPVFASDYGRFGIMHYPAACLVGFDSALGAVNSANSGRLIAAWRVGVVICAPVRSVT